MYLIAVGPADAQVFVGSSSPLAIPFGNWQKLAIAGTRWNVGVQKARSVRGGGMRRGRHAASDLRGRSGAPEAPRCVVCVVSRYWRVTPVCGNTVTDYPTSPRSVARQPTSGHGSRAATGGPSRLPGLLVVVGLLLPIRIRIAVGRRFPRRSAEGVSHFLETRQGRLGRGTRNCRLGGSRCARQA